MSSSHTYVSNDRLRQLERDARRSYQSEQEIQAIRASAAQRERDIQGQYQSNLNSLNSRITSMSSQHNAEIRRVSEEFRNNIARQTADFQGQFNRLSADVRGIDNRVTTLATDFSERFDRLARAQADTRAHAETAIAELTDLLSTIRELCPGKFAPGDYEALAEQLARAQACLSQGDYQAALAITHVRLTDAARLLHRLSLLNAHFDGALTRAREQANTVSTAIGELTAGKPSHEFDIKDVNGEVQHYNLHYEINFWTNGLFANVQRQSEEINRTLENAENSPAVNIERLDEISNELNHLYRNENGAAVGFIADLDQHGRAEQIRSFAVGDMAIQVHNRLNEQGWQLVDSGRVSDDDREPYTMSYEDGTGNRVALIVNAGDKEGSTGIDVEVFMNDGARDTAHSREIKDSVENTIDNLSGDIHVGRRERRNDCHENTSPEVFIENRAREAAQRNEARLRTQQMEG